MCVLIWAASVLLLRASRGPIARFSPARHRAFHRVAVDGTGVVQRNPRLHMKLDVVSVHGTLQRARLTWTLKASRDRVSVLR